MEKQSNAIARVSAWRGLEARGYIILGWIILIHATALIGLVLYPLPGWGIFFGAVALAFLGGLGTTVCYHRALSHRAVKLAPWLTTVLTFFAMATGSGAPVSWVANHRLHHSYADTPEDISSPVYFGFFWAHLAWLWAAKAPSPERFCPDLNVPKYRAWRVFQPFILTLSYVGPLWFGSAAFFWLGAIRLCFSLHAQCFVNSICHTEPGIAPGEDSSRNIGWLGLVQFLQGENWHRNHHLRPSLARLGWSWRQPDLGYAFICAFEKLGLASDVRHLRDVVPRAAEPEAA